MRKPVIISAVLHVAILVAAMVTLPRISELPPAQSRVLPVELVTNITDITNLRRKATPIEEQKPSEEEKPKVAEQVPEPEPQPQPEEKAEPLPEPKKEEPKPEPEKKAELKKEEQKPEKKPEPPKKDEKKPKKKAFDPNALAKLLNKLPDDAAPKQETKSAKENDNSPTTDDPDAELSLDVQDAFKQQMRECWNPQLGAPGNEDLSVKIRIYLNQDGTLSQPPEYEDRMRVMTGSTYYRASAEAALRAIRRCAPYKLPASSYSGWKEMILNFDPRQMLGG